MNAESPAKKLEESEKMRIYMFYHHIYTFCHAKIIHRFNKQKPILDSLLQMGRDTYHPPLCYGPPPAPLFLDSAGIDLHGTILFYKVKMTQSNYTYCDKSIGKSNSKRKINAIRNYPCQLEYSGSNHFYRSPFSSCSPNALASATVEVAEGAVLSTLSTGIALGTCGQLLLICPVDLQPLQACLSCLGSVQAEQCRRTPCLCSN